MKAIVTICKLGNKKELKLISQKPFSSVVVLVVYIFSVLEIYLVERGIAQTPTLTVRD